MSLAKEELAARIIAFRKDLRVPTAVVTGATTVFAIIAMAAVALLLRGVLRSAALGCLLLAVSTEICLALWWTAKLKTLRQEHGLLCGKCGNFVTRSGFRIVQSTSCCERCDSPL
jgi:hypothetical protein